MNLLLLLFIVIVVVACVVAYNRYSAHRQNVPYILNELKNASSPQRKKLMDLLDAKINELKTKQTEQKNLTNKQSAIENKIQENITEFQNSAPKLENTLLLENPENPNKKNVDETEETEGKANISFEEANNIIFNELNDDYNKVSDYVTTVAKQKKPIELHWLKYLDARQKVFKGMKDGRNPQDKFNLLWAKYNKLREFMVKHNSDIADLLSCSEKMCASDIKNVKDFRNFMLSMHPDKDGVTPEEKERAALYRNFAYSNYLAVCKTENEFCDKK
jgi:hypothetical protein